MLDYIVLFILNAAGMILELVASRLLSPYFGNSNFVWTAIIGIILFAGSLGNIIGGKLASRKNPRFWASMLLLFAAIYVAVTPLLDVPVLQSIKDIDFGVQFASVVGSIIFFLIPATIMGIVTPIIMKERIGEGKKKAEESGRITAIIAIGSLVGTFLGGFWLIPSLGTKMIFVFLAIIIIPMAPLLRPFNDSSSKARRHIFIVSILVTILLCILSFVMVGTGSKTTSISIDTEYGRIIVEEGDFNGESVLFYKQSGAYSSATFLDENKKYDLVFEYLKKYDIMFDFLKVKNVAMIGGAAYQYPKYFISHFADKAMDVIEIDPVSTEIAMRYFFLDDLVEQYGDERIGLYNEDGRLFLANAQNKYDAVLNDAFSGDVPVGTLTTKEAAEIIKKSLTQGGVYISNVLGAVSGDKGKFLRSEVKTLSKVFKHVYVLRVFKNVKTSSLTNWMVIATDNDGYRPDDIVDVELSDDDIVLTDDYNPIDSLILPNYHD